MESDKNSVYRSRHPRTRAVTGTDDAAEESAIDCADNAHCYILYMVTRGRLSSNRVKL